MSPQASLSLVILYYQEDGLLKVPIASVSVIGNWLLLYTQGCIVLKLDVDTLANFLLAYIGLSGLITLTCFLHCCVTISMGVARSESFEITTA